MTDEHQPSIAYDFGYSWLWSHGHALLAGVLLAVAAGLVVAGQFFAGLPPWSAAIPVAMAAWALAGYVLLRRVFRAHEPLTMPTDQFLPGGRGLVIDLGAGSGRTSIMVGLARPEARIVALDNFSARYIRDHGEERLFGNLALAGVDDRVELRRGDMRHLEFPDRHAEGAVSSYAMDHLGRDIPTALAETHRVLRPGGQFLLMVILPDLWMNIVYPGLVGLAFLTRRRWRELLEEAGLELVAEGKQPGGGWFLVRRS